MQLSAHRIRRQSWRCSTRSREEAFALRGRLREALEEAVPAAFERAFDEAVPGGEVVRLPRLELTVRLSRAEDFQALLPELLRRAVGEQLQSLLRPGERSAPAVTRMWRSRHESRLEGLVRYLTTGALPWELGQTETSTLSEGLRETARDELLPVLDHAPDERTPLPQTIAFFFRLLQLLPVEKWEEIATHLSPRSPVSTLHAFRQAVSALGGDLPKGITLASPGRAAEGSPGRESREKHASEESSAQPRRGGRSETGTSVPPLPGLEMEGVEIRRPLGAHATGLPPDAPDGALNLPTGAPPAIAFPVEGEAVGTNVFPVAVRCAGLVLLHPFLSRLFENRGIEPGHRWADLPRAAALLHWLATGRDEVLEFELGFVKALLGQRPEAALLVSEGLLTEADRAEGEALLRAAIGHWRALKGTTPAGLRGSFLQRGGLLREEEKGWRLQVEPAAFDVLLDHLPWGIGVVKLPWMTKPIFTEWPTP